MADEGHTGVRRLPRRVSRSTTESSFTNRKLGRGTSRNIDVDLRLTLDERREGNEVNDRPGLSETRRESDTAGISIIRSSLANKSHRLVADHFFSLPSRVLGVLYLNEVSQVLNSISSHLNDEDLVKALFKAEQIWIMSGVESKKDDNERGLYIATGVVRGYGNLTTQPDYAASRIHSILSSITRRDKPLFNASIAALCRLGDMDGSLLLLDQMISSQSIGPSEPAYLSLIGCSVRKSRPEISKRLFESARMLGYKLDIISYNQLLSTALKAHDFAWVDSVLDYMRTSPTPISLDRISFCTLVSGSISISEFSRAERYLALMVSSGHGPSVRYLWFRVLLVGYFRQGDWDRVKGVLDILVLSGKRGDSSFWNLVLVSCLKEVKVLARPGWERCLQDLVLRADKDGTSILNRKQLDGVLLSVNTGVPSSTIAPPLTSARPPSLPVPASHLPLTIADTGLSRPRLTDILKDIKNSNTWPTAAVWKQCVFFSITSAHFSGLTVLLNKSRPHDLNRRLIGKMFDVAIESGGEKVRELTDQLLRIGVSVPWSIGRGGGDVSVGIEYLRDLEKKGIAKDAHRMGFLKSLLSGAGAEMIQRMHGQVVEQVLESMDSGVDQVAMRTWMGYILQKPDWSRVVREGSGTRYLHNQEFWKVLLDLPQDPRDVLGLWTLILGSDKDDGTSKATQVPAETYRTRFLAYTRRFVRWVDRYESKHSEEYAEMHYARLMTCFQNMTVRVNHPLPRDFQVLVEAVAALGRSDLVIRTIKMGLQDQTRYPCPRIYLSLFSVLASEGNISGLDMLLSNGHTGPLTTDTLVVYLWGLLKAGEFERVPGVVGEWVGRGVLPHDKTRVMILRSVIAMDKIGLAEEMVESSRDMSLDAWREMHNVVLLYFARQADVVRVAEMVGLMEERGVGMDSFSFSAVLEGYGRAGGLESVKEIWKGLVGGSFDVELNAAHLCLVLDACGWCGDSKSGQEIWFDALTRVSVGGASSQGGSRRMVNGNAVTSYLEMLLRCEKYPDAVDEFANIFGTKSVEALVEERLFLLSDRRGGGSDGDFDNNGSYGISSVGMEESVAEEFDGLRRSNNLTAMEIEPNLKTLQTILEPLLSNGRWVEVDVVCEMVRQRAMQGSDGVPDDKAGAGLRLWRECEKIVSMFEKNAAVGNAGEELESRKERGPVKDLESVLGVGECLSK